MIGIFSFFLLLTLYSFIYTIFWFCWFKFSHSYSICPILFCPPSSTFFLVVLVAHTLPLLFVVVFFFYHVRVHMSKWPQRSGYQWQTRTQPEQSKLILSPTVRIFQVRGKKTKLKSFLIWCNSKFRSYIVSTWLTQINTAQAQTFEPVQTSTCANKNSSSAGVNTYFWY